MLFIVYSVAWDVCILSGVLLIGFAVGRQLGVRQGRRQAQAALPLQLRSQIYQAGLCPVCDTSFFGDDTISQKGVALHEHQSDFGRTTEKFGIG